MTHSKKCGENSLISIYAATSYEAPDAMDVVRWCDRCGAVVVDRCGNENEISGE